MTPFFLLGFSPLPSILVYTSKLTGLRHDVRLRCLNLPRIARRKQDSPDISPDIRISDLAYQNSIADKQSHHDEVLIVTGNQHCCHVGRSDGGLQVICTESPLVIFRFPSVYASCNFAEVCCCVETI